MPDERDETEGFDAEIFGGEEETLGETTEEPKKEAREPKKTARQKGNVGKEINIKVGAGEPFKGLCIAERNTPSGAQVFLQLNGCVSRWFNTSDIF